MAHSTLNKPDEQFLAQANTINNQCNHHKTEWKIDSDSLTEFDGLPADNCNNLRIK
ncbi:MAG: hypothetical protein LBP85_10920 [Prevotellaceae bacterium]|jgi:hypothetical protein|nr:hypothetical protein [Prevotellaceae bacterium]